MPIHQKSWAGKTESMILYKKALQKIVRLDAQSLMISVAKESVYSDPALLLSFR